RRRTRRAVARRRDGARRVALRLRRALALPRRPRAAAPSPRHPRRLRTGRRVDRAVLPDEGLVMRARLPRATPLTDLRALLDVLRREGEIVTVDAEVDPDLETAEIHRRVIAAGGPALLFRNVRGSPWPLVTNLFGTARRVELAFGPRPQAFVERLAALPHELLPPTPGRLWAQRDLATALLGVGRR